MIEKSEYRFLSILDPSEIKAIVELPKKAICGFFVNDDSIPENFVPNQEFIDCLHNTIRNHGHRLNLLREAALRQRDGYIYIIDLRTKQGIMGDVPPEDIIGAFKVCDAKIVFDEYSPNENYKIFTKSGLIKLPQELKEILIEEMKE